MNYSVLLLVVFTITAIKNEGTEALNVVNMETAFSPVQVKDPWWGSSSSGILKSHTVGSYFTSRVRNLTLSAPKGYGIVAAIRMIDLRPNSLDKLTLSSVGTLPASYTNTWSYRHRTYDSRETLQTFNAPNGQLVVTFATGSGFVSSFGYDGFQLTYTSYSTDFVCRSDEFKCSNRRCIANVLTCDGHNHCGDGSDQFLRACSLKSSPNVAGIVCGVIFLLIAAGCAVFIIVRRARRAQAVSGTVVTSHPPPPTYQPPAQPGTCYPPPPPQYSQYPQGHVNPAYR